MKSKLFKKEERGTKDIGWLKSNFSLSFSSYQNPLRAGFGLIRAFNDDYISPKGGFGIHAHHNMEIISIILKGDMNHKDSMGYSDVVHEDWIQIMSAGSGLYHEEYNIGEEDVNFLQIWIEPKVQNINPRYQRRHFPKEQRENQLTTVIAPTTGYKHCWINQDAYIKLGNYTEEKTLNYQFTEENKCVYLFNIKGEIQIDGQIISPRDSIGIWGTNEISIHIKADSQFILIEAPINH